MRTLTAYGHSWVQGDGATSPKNRLVDVAAHQLGFLPVNLGVGGSLSTETAALVSGQPAPRSDVYLLMTGLNDGRLHGDYPGALDDFSTALCALFDAFFATSPARDSLPSNNRISSTTRVTLRTTRALIRSWTAATCASGRSPMAFPR